MLLLQIVEISTDSSGRLYVTLIRLQWIYYLLHEEILQTVKHADGGVGLKDTSNIASGFILSSSLVYNL
jgi:hypothetical protein